MEYPIFDTHAHYSARAFDADRFALLDSLPGKGVVGVCEQATHSGDAPKVLELAHKYPWVYAAVGIHPESLLAPKDCGEEGPAPTVSVYGGDWAAEMRALAPYYEDPKVVAVGECGLDYHWPVPKDAQLALFEAEIRLALELDKPIIVHDRSAHADVYALLKKYRPKGIVHCYSGSADDALWLAEQGLYIGFGGACTFKGAKRAAKAIAALPLERIVLETDCPYMAPEPHRGQRNDSSLIIHVAEVLGQVKGLSVQEVLEYVNGNYQDSLTLGTFCEQKHYSVAYISRRFKQETGVTLREYVQNVRIEKSCELLEDSDLRVVEIARRVGYEDIKFFNQIFKRRMQISPREYRKICMNRAADG